MATVALIRRLALAAVLLGSAAAGGAAPLRVTDDTGSTVTLAAPAQRIVALSPHATELLYAAGAGGALVGAVQHSDYPAVARDLPRVGQYDALDYERIVDLHPDLVVAWGSGNGSRALDRLRDLGLTVYVSEPRSLDAIPRTIEDLGRLAGTAGQARQRADAFRRRRMRLQRHYSDRTPVSVFLEIWHEPLMTVGGPQMISRVIRLCGGRNVFSGLSSLAPTVTREAVLAKQPEAIVATAARRPPWLGAWARWPSLPAVQHGNLFWIDPDLINRQTPRVLDGAEALCRDLEIARERLGTP